MSTESPRDENMTPDDDAFLDEGPSRSARKRDADAVRELGRRLAELSVSERAALPLEEDIRDAVEQLNAIRRGSAHKRQLSFLAKRLRRLDDLEPIRAALAELDRSAQVDRAHHHRSEAWRDRLLGTDPAESAADALTAYLDAHPAADRQRLRQLQKRALGERASGRSPSAARELFRLVRDTARDPARAGAEPRGRADPAP